MCPDCNAIVEVRQWKRHRSFHKPARPSGGGASKALKAAVKRRDGSRCRGCGKTSQQARLEVHHVNGRWFDNRPENLITLCQLCHVEADRLIGARTPRS